MNETNDDKIMYETGITGRNVYDVCAGCTRPIGEKFTFINSCLHNWNTVGVTVDERIHMKHILNVSDCRLGIHEGLILVESPQGGLVVIDIHNNNDDWASVPWD